MTDLRTAAQQALEALELVTDLTNHDDEIYGAIDALRAALAQQAEPVEPVEPVGAAGLFTLAHLWAQQCYFKGLGRPCDIDSARGAFEQALKAYTAPPQRKPLTDEEIESCRQQGYAHAGLSAPFDFGKAARAVERLLGGGSQVADHLARHGIPMPDQPLPDDHDENPSF